MTWNAVKGSPTAYLLMTFLPEVAFVGVCAWTIWKMRPGERLNGRMEEGVKTRMEGGVGGQERLRDLT